MKIENRIEAGDRVRVLLTDGEWLNAIAAPSDERGASLLVVCMAGVIEIQASEISTRIKRGWND